MTGKSKRMVYRCCNWYIDGYEIDQKDLLSLDKMLKFLKRKSTSSSSKKTKISEYYLKIGNRIQFNFVISI